MQVEKFLDCYALELHSTSKTDLRQGDLNNLSYPSWQNYSKFGNVTSIEKSMINPATGFDLMDMKFC